MPICMSGSCWKRNWRQVNGEHCEWLTQVITQRTDPLDVDLALVGMTIDVDGELIATGAGAAVKGSPVNSLIWLANTLGALGITCKAGEVILTGSLSIMAWVKGPQTITCEFGGLGSCSVTFE